MWINKRKEHLSTVLRMDDNWSVMLECSIHIHTYLHTLYIISYTYVNYSTRNSLFFEDEQKKTSKVFEFSLRFSIPFLMMLQDGAREKLMKVNIVCRFVDVSKRWTGEGFIHHCCCIMGIVRKNKKNCKGLMFAVFVRIHLMLPLAPPTPPP